MMDRLAGNLAAGDDIAPPSGLAQRFAPIDLTGTWVSVVTEDWAQRMLTPQKGDFESQPLTRPRRTPPIGQASRRPPPRAGRARPTAHRS
jgi:hypothetical protein